MGEFNVTTFQTQASHANFFMEFSKVPLLSALAVFKNIINEELIRSFHVYQVEDGKEMGVEREFLFNRSSTYVEMVAQPLLQLSRVKFSELFEGQQMGVWLCMLVFDIKFPPYSTHIPSLLVVSRNPKLKSIPTLADDLQNVFQFRCRVENTLPSEIADENICEEDSDNNHGLERVVPVFDQDLNCLPCATGVPSASENHQSVLNLQGDVPKKKKKKAVSERIAGIALDDLVKYFGLPITEASRNLKVGLTVLKRKCRELGIPRWPHRKIKSLDTLIHDLQEEAERQEQKNKAAAMAVKKRKRMLESEKESIERKPFMEIQSETKRFRQDVFKRRHRARALKNKS
ncbi:hypothetical protein IFM89_003893 [Coptis chinensis]|uniref:RWP-RK domain-containing protein n=1 Tax=Coptis chinensis TaxID=261450 RepID=A0A835LTV7_9MAGN|nr:hypothetical protein IFM89_003893 [Coptis chinensis]